MKYYIIAGEASGDLRLQIIYPLTRILSKAVILAIQPELLVQIIPTFSPGWA